MPMHPQCRQRHLERNNFNIALTIFLPVTTMTAKQDYMKEYYRPEVEAERKEAREREFIEQVKQWHGRMQSAEAEGRAFDEPLPDYPEEPEPWWERLLDRIGVWRALIEIEDRLPAPLGKIAVFALIILGILLTIWFVGPIALYNVQREWNAMLRRDREYRGDVACDYCGDRFLDKVLPGHAPPDR